MEPICNRLSEDSYKTCCNYIECNMLGNNFYYSLQIEYFIEMKKLQKNEGKMGDKKCTLIHSLKT